MVGRFVVSDKVGRLLPGKPSDYLATEVFYEPHRELYKQDDVRRLIYEDEAPLPTAEAREGYYGDRHLEYWLSGYSDAEKVVRTIGLDRQSTPLRILDFGGASGRTIRHFRYLTPGSELFMCDLNVAHVAMCRSIFKGRIASVRNFPAPHLPFPDGYFDCVTAFSVFTHLDTDDLGWLLELRRITRPGGSIYITVHDDATWSILEETFVADVSFSNADFQTYYRKNQNLDGKVVHFYNENSEYNCNTFVSANYMKEFWFPHFSNARVIQLFHQYQSVAVLVV